MIRFLVRATVLSLGLAILAATPVAAEVIKKGTDYWRTPAGGSTRFTFPVGDVESFCRARRPYRHWNHQVLLRGIPAQGSDWDSAVERLEDATFDPSGTAHTRVNFQSLALTSIAPSDTPCGKLNWEVRLAKGRQPITEMKITKTSERGGAFAADLALRVEMRATNADTGASVGSLFYDVNLPDPTGGTVWSYSKENVFRPGINTDDDCIQVLREKIGDFPEDSEHFYFISDLIARGVCREKGALP